MQSEMSEQTTKTTPNMKSRFTLFAEERRERILELLSQHGRVTIAELVEILGVTEPTVRKDLDFLHRQQVIRRTHGGAVLLVPTLAEPTIEQRQSSNMAEKQAIARTAASLITDGDTLLLDSGSTTECLVPYLRDFQDVTVVTNSIRIVTGRGAFPHLQHVLLGGSLRPNSGALVGPLALEALERMRFTTLFLGTTSLNLEDGLTVPELTEAHMKRKMIERSRSVIVLADHTKIGLTSFIHVAPIDAINTLVTDSIDAETGRILRERGIQVVTAQYETETLTDGTSLL